LGNTLPRILRRVARVLGLAIVASLWTAIPCQAQHLDAADVHVPLDSAVHLAQKAAASAFPDLSDYLLYSVTPRVLKGDPRGLHWEVRWEERAFPQHRWLVVRVYMEDGYTAAERSPPDTVGGSSPAQPR
jgi:hypothetical protein